MQQDMGCGCANSGDRMQLEGAQQRMFASKQILEQSHAALAAQTAPSPAGIKRAYAVFCSGAHPSLRVQVFGK